MEKIEQINIGDTQWELNDALEKYKPDTMAKVLDKLVEVIEKQGEIINHLNSQDQEEENTVCEGCGKTIASRFMQSYTKGDGMHSYCLSCDPEKQDTPEEKEEWEEKQRSLVEKAQIEVLTEIFQVCYQEDSKTLELVEEKLSKLTTK